MNSKKKPVVKSVSTKPKKRIAQVASPQPGFPVDGNERMQSEQALRESERKFREIVTYLDEGYYSCTMEGVLLDHNRAFNRMLGFEISQDLRGRKLPDFWQNPEDRKGYVSELMTKGVIRNYLINAKTIGGDKIVTIANSHLVKDEKGKPVRIEGTFTDITDRKRMEDSLKESEAKYRALFDNAQIGMYRTKLDGSAFLEVNDKFAKMLGFSPQKLIGAPGRIRWANPEDRDKMLKQLQEQGGILTNYETQVTAKNGEVKDVLASIKLYPGEGYLEGTMTDITTLKQAEAALRESEERHRMVADYTYDWEYWRAPDRRILYISPSCERITGYRAGEFMENPGLLDTIVHPDDHFLFEQHKSLMQKDEGEQRVHKTAFRIMRKDGGMRWIGHTCLAIHRADGTSLGRRATNRDITEQKQAEEEIRKLNTELEQRVSDRTAQLQIANEQLEGDLTERERAQEALRESEERFRRLSEATCEAIVIHDGGILLNANSQYSEMFGYEPEELLGKQVMPLTIAPEAMEAVRKEIATGGVGPYESTGQRKDGTRFPIEVRVRELEYKGRKVRVAAIMDITGRKRAEQALQQRTAQLEVANQELEAFSYSVSHDLRAPLRAMDGFSAALLAGYPDKLEEQGRHYLDRIRDASQRMGQLIEDLLNLSSITRSPLNRQPVDLSTLTQEVAVELQKRDPQRQVEFIIAEKMALEADPHLLRIVFQNLLDNAWKFTGPRLQAVIEIGCEPCEGSEPSYGSGSTYFVKDNGVGFDMAYVDKLFAPFQRLHSLHEFPGTGIGLATVQRIVARHGGRAWAEAQVDKGATFYFTLGGP